jgi:hypothetical protein
LIFSFFFFFFFSAVDSEPIFPLVMSLCLFLLVGSWSVRWANIYRGVPSNTDPEPGRCRRTDGKKWRCGRDVVPDQKYCERHMHRGRHRSRKHADGSQAAAAATGGGGGGGGAAASTLLSPRSAAGTSATSASSSGSGAVSSVTTTNVGPIRGSGGGGGSTSTTTTGGGGGAATAVSTSGGGSSSCSPFSLTSCLQQRSSSNLAVKTFSSSHSGSPAHHGGSGGGSSPAASSQFGQLPSLSSSPSQGASTLTNKDYRWAVLPHDPHTIHILFLASAAITPPDFSSSSLSLSLSLSLSRSVCKALVQPPPHNPHDLAPQLLTSLTQQLTYLLFNTQNS